MYVLITYVLNYEFTKLVKRDTEITDLIYKAYDL